MSELTLQDRVRLQLAEVEMLSSMYPRRDEFRLANASAVNEFQDFLDGKTDSISTSLDLCFKIATESGMVDFEVHLPHRYPSTPLEFTIRSDSLDRNGHGALTKEVSDFVMSQQPDSLVVGDAVELIRETFAKYSRSKSKARIAHAPKQPLTRLWIVSHHIYNKNKRRLILECGSQGALTGFCLPGKPGIICFEGPQQECLDAWSTIKGLTWHRIGLKHQENFVFGSGQHAEAFRKFGKFAEIAFNTKQNASRDHHMDMGEFVKFLKARNLGHMFELLFGIEAKE